jgi:hypothetical protein
MSHLLSLFALPVLLTMLALQPPDPQAIIDRAFEAHGAHLIADSEINFDFRGRSFSVTHDGGSFDYARTYTDSTGVVLDVLNNEGFSRALNGTTVDLTERMLQFLPGSVNSVVYFAFLPHKLNDPAVRKRYLGLTAIKGENYHAIEIKFAQEGGGSDWSDVFIYWIHEERNTMDYLAYLYHVNGGGTRFREAHNIRTIQGIRIADYRNYKAESDALPLEEYASAFSRGELIKVSDVDLEGVQVELTGK